jgi:predicted Zn-dependent peptidase
VRQDFVDHKRHLYTKDNLVITIAGRIEDEDTMARQVATAFDALPETRHITDPVFGGVTTQGDDHYIK